MGIFDWPRPIFVRLDEVMHFLPPTLRLVLWAIIGAGLSMAIYRAMSPQRRIAAAETEARTARQVLNAYDGELQGAWPLIGRALGASGYYLWLVLPAAVVASLPLLAMIVWLSTAYGYRFPGADGVVEIEVDPSHFDAQLVERFHGTAMLPDRRLLIANERGTMVAEVPLYAPVPVIEKRRWWNFLIGNPTGYLPTDGAVERVEMPLPRQEVVPFGPAWLRGWEILYFTVLILSSIAIKKLCRIV